MTDAYSTMMIVPMVRHAVDTDPEYLQSVEDALAVELYEADPTLDRHRARQAARTAVKYVIPRVLLGQNAGLIGTL